MDIKPLLLKREFFATVIEKLSGSSANLVILIDICSLQNMFLQKWKISESLKMEIYQSR